MRFWHLCLSQRGLRRVLFGWCCCVVGIVWASGERSPGLGSCRGFGRGVRDGLRSRRHYYRRCGFLTREGVVIDPMLTCSQNWCNVTNEDLRMKKMKSNASETRLTFSASARDFDKTQATDKDSVDSLLETRHSLALPLFPSHSQHECPIICLSLRSIPQEFYDI